MMNTEPHEVCTVQAVHVESPIVDPKESSVQGDGSEKKSDVAPACTGGSESTNSGNVSSLVSSFFMSLPRDQMLGGAFDDLYNLQGPDAPIFDETPQCKGKDGMNFGETPVEGQNVEAVPDQFMALHDPSDSSIQLWTSEGIPKV